MRRVLAILVLCGWAWSQGDDSLEKARERVRALESDIIETIDRAAPAVGAVLNYATQIDANTGRISMNPRSLGSGVVITRDGFFLTNVHVVEGAGYLTVTLPGKVRCRAVLYADTSDGKVKGDIALLKLTHPQGERFPCVDWRAGNPKLLQPGSFVFAMGNPHGHARDGTPVVTLGILSGKGRAAAEAGYLYVDALQTDAEINPGNSGGPLFDSRGNFIGINGLMSSRAGRSNSGIGFAIPIDQVRLFLRKLLKDEGGGVGYGFHGLSVISETGEKGAKIVAVDRRSPADEAGLESKDIITRVNRKKVNNRSDFVNIVGKLPEGSYVSVTYARRRRSRSVRFRLIAFSEYEQKIGRNKRAGPLPLNERGYLGLEWEAGRAGLRVTKIVPETGAEKAGLAPGDIVAEVDGRAVEDGKKLMEQLSLFAADQLVSVSYTRNEKTKRVMVRLCDAASAAGLGE